ncbi:DUF4145 domain-containing protein [Xanthomonas campestris pv. campestris]|uniref:DUF4145 domain-containing protein n=1 Tax=Xanthomonas campestris TaxID=339 RepID=UPI001F4735C6|nr:DUF4145 domain-containing protein [Xanthomonas campestris]MCF8809656.1 DUF4145 domain-containing protein [Xanthomonas campestris pv. campestris]
MSYFVTTCPHCSAEKMTMTSVASAKYSAKISTAMFSCGACSNILCVRFSHDRDDSWVYEPWNFEEALFSNNGKILMTYPQVEEPTCPEDVSENVRRAYLQAIDNAARSNNDAAAAMFRKALDISTRELDQQLANKNLKPRIDALFNAGRLTSDLKDWAHQIRLDGNEGAHDEEELTPDQIRQLARFTELFLIYTFTLPAAVNRIKSEADSPSA